MTHTTPFFEFVLVIPCALLILLAALLWTGNRKKWTCALNAAEFTGTSCNRLLAVASSSRYRKLGGPFRKNFVAVRITPVGRCASSAPASSANGGRPKRRPLQSLRLGVPY
jgi:hypothetical protein